MRKELEKEKMYEAIETQIEQMLDDEKEEDLSDLLEIESQRKSCRGEMIKLKSVRELLEERQKKLRQQVRHGRVRLSKHSLKKAKIIAQVENKFILIKSEDNLIAID